MYLIFSGFLIAGHFLKKDTRRHHRYICDNILKLSDLYDLQVALFLLLYSLLVQDTQIHSNAP